MYLTLLILILIACLVLLGIALSWLGWIIPPLLGGGAPFVATEMKTVELMIKLAQIKPTDIICDLGSGDGRIVIAAAKAGAHRAIGYELQGSLVKQSRSLAQQAGVANQCEFLKQSMWKADLSKINVVILYQISYAMKGLAEKLKSELPAGARIISSSFVFPDWEPNAREENVRVYVTSGKSS